MNTWGYMINSFLIKIRGTKYNTYKKSLVIKKNHKRVVAINKKYEFCKEITEQRMFYRLI